MKDIKDERWQPIIGYEGFYEISDHGRVKSLPRVKKVYKGNYYTKEKILQPLLSGTGKNRYYSVGLHKTGIKSIRVLIHILVAKYYIQNPEGKPQINHKDGNKANNHHANLEWVTSAENINHAFENGLNRKMGQNEPAFSKPVLQMDLNGNLLQKHPSLNEAYRKTGIPTSNIHSAIQKNGTAKGYRWAYFVDRTDAAYTRHQISKAMLEEARRLGRDNDYYHAMWNFVSEALDAIDAKTTTP